MLISFEGLDGSGKETQTKLLESKLNQNGFKSIRIAFPNYGEEYSLFVKKYLSGEFGKELNPYLKAIFFGLDRFGTYKKYMKLYLEKGYIVICDRYIHSNLIYHGSCIEDLSLRDKLFNWILDFEYNICGLPKSDLTFFMDISLDINLNIIEKRNGKDIHESNVEFLKKCYKNAKYISKKYDFINIKCDKDGELFSVDFISEKIYEEVLKRYR